MKPSDRQVALLLRLQTRDWWRAADLGGILGVDRKTIYSDMRALVKAGFPVITRRGKGCRLSEDFFIPPIRLTSDEAMLLLSHSREEDSPDLFGISYSAAVRGIRAKLLAALPDSSQPSVARLRGKLRLVALSTFDNAAEPEKRDLLRQALGECRAVQFVLGKEILSIKPYGFVRVAGVQHLVGYDNELEVVRHYRVDAMQSLSLLSDTFERPRPYTGGYADIGEEMVVRVRFDLPTASGVRKSLPSCTVDIQEEEDGTYVTLVVGREAEVIPWLLSWGTHAEVLSPVSLQGRIVEIASSLAERYRSAQTLFS